MSEEKTEQPTPKKIRDARDKGQVSNSKEVVSASVMVGMYIILFMFGGFLVEGFMELILLPAEFYEVTFDEGLGSMIDHMEERVMVLLAPMVGGAVVVGIFANYIQIGPIFSADPLIPKPDKISPIAGFKRIFSMKNFMEFIKSIVKVIVIVVACYFIIIYNIEDLMRLPICQEKCILPYLGHLMLQLALYSSAAFILLAMADIFFQKYEHTKSLKMTKDEVKREFKDTEGNPEIKGKRKQIHKELVQGDGGQKAVKKSTVVVTNPRHLAIGLRYDGKKFKVPRVTIKGEDLVAKMIKEIAHDNDIPIMENVPLARSLYAQVDVGDPIPKELFQQVAEVLKWVRSLKEEVDE